MKLSALNCISRGLVNLRANWELIPVQLMQSFLVGILILVGLLPPLAAVGWSSFDLLEPEAESIEALFESVAGFLGRGSQAWLLLAAGLVITSVIWLIAMLVYCYFQAGIFGILRAGDRQAPPGPQSGWQWYRTFSVRDLRGFGGLYLWRFFWLFNLLLLVSLALVVLLVGWALLIALGQSRWGSTAAVGIGCGGLLPILFFSFVLAFWLALAQADLPRENAGVWLSAKRALTVVGRRLAALLLFAVLGLVLTVGMALVVLAISLPTSLLAHSSMTSSIAVSLILNLVQWVVSGAISVGFAAVMTALMRSETLLMGTSP